MTLQNANPASPEALATAPGLPEGTMAIGETDRLIASDRVAGTEVYDKSGKSLGSIYNFMVDKVSGQAAYAVLSFGGFLGLGERFYPLPWQSLHYDPARGGYVVDLDKDRLDKAPSYAPGDDPWANPSYARDIYGYYGFGYGL